MLTRPDNTAPRAAAPSTGAGELEGDGFRAPGYARSLLAITIQLPSGSAT
jgi:hypothetical protein